MKLVLICLLILILTENTLQRQQFLGPKTHARKKPFVQANPLSQNIVQMGQNEQQTQKQLDKEESQQQNTNQTKFLQSKSPLDSDQQDFNRQNYQKSDYYIWEEGVTNLAYDDFLTTKFVNNIEYLGVGYNIAYGNPRSTKGIDPGYRIYNAFTYKYEDDKLDALSTDADYFVPVGVKLNTKTACQVSFDSKSYSSAVSYKESLKVGASVKGKYPSFAFSASADFKQNKEGMEKSDSTYIDTDAMCAVHHVGISRYNPPSWSPDLVQALKSLSKSNYSQNYWRFFEEFGTHVTVEVDLGAIFGYKYQMNRVKTQQLTSQGVNVEAAVKAYGTKASVSTEHSKQESESASSAMESWSMYSIGAPPDADNDPMAWAAQSKDSPMPIKGVFVPWEDFIIDYRANTSGFTDKEIKALTKNFVNNYNTYCEKYLVPNKIVDQCEYKEPEQNPLEDGVNVPGGKKNPAIDYTKLGGDSGYKWTEIVALGSGNKAVCADELGYAYAITKSGAVKFKKPNTSKWSTLGSSDKNGVRCGAANGRMVQATDSSNKYKAWYKDVKINGSWMELVGDWRGIDIDQSSRIVGRKEKGRGVLLNGPNDKERSIQSNINLDWVSVNGQFVYAQHREKKYDLRYGYSNSGISKSGVKVQDNTRAISGCITEAGWGYKIDESNNIWFMQSIEADVIPVQVGGKLKQIYCQSTSDGPIVYGINKDGDVVFREAQ